MKNRLLPSFASSSAPFNRRPVNLRAGGGTHFPGAFVRWEAAWAVAAALWFAIVPVRGAKILWVSDAPPELGFSGADPTLTDGGFIRLLQAAGHTVERFDNPESTAEIMPSEDVTRINSFDLIIIGRATLSGQFQDGQGDQWNTEITKPLICMSPYLIRTSARMGWFDGGTLPDNAVPTVVTAADPASEPDMFLQNKQRLTVDFLLGGVEMLGNSTVDPFDEVLDRNTSHITDPVVPGGRVLLSATFPTEANEANEVTSSVIADFPAGTSVRTGLNVLAGYRMYMAGGSREGASAPNQIPLYTGRETLTPTGESIFLRAVELALRNGDPAVLTGGTMAITRQPANLTAREGDPARFSLAVTGAAPRTLQWQRDAGAGLVFTNIPDASTTFPVSAYTLASVRRGDNAAQFRVVVSNANNVVTSAVVTLTVTADTAAPVPLSAASVAGTTIDVYFDEVIDNAGGALQNPANYRVNGGQGPTVTTATPRADGKSVVLVLSAAAGATFTVNIANLADQRGNAIPAAGVTVNGTTLGLTTTPIGALNPEGTSFARGPAMVEVTGGGLDLQSALDQFQFIHKTLTGDFDARTRVDSMVGDGRFESVAKAILTARESTAEDSAAVIVFVTPATPGNDVIMSTVRLSTGDVTNAVGDPFMPNGLPGNAWMRLTRTGDLFTAYRSTDGAQWVELGKVSAPLAPALQVGVGAVSHRNTRTMTATFSNLQLGGPPPPPPPAELRLFNFSRQASSFSASFQSQNSVTYTPQYKDALSAPAWTSLPSIAGDGGVKTFTDTSISSANARFYRVSRP